MPEPLPADILAAFAASADRRGRFGTPAVFMAEAPSTNDVAIELAEQGAPEGTMVLALAQTAGRGRLGRQWFSPAGAGLYASVICRSGPAAPMLTLAGGVAVAEGIRTSTALPVLLKWPNDVVVIDSALPGRPRKLAGVLAEGSSGAEGFQYVVLGFGVNLRPAAYPAGLAVRATSIEAELGREVDRAALLAEILAALNARAAELARGDRTALLARWRTLAPSATGARVEWTVNGRPYQGTTQGIADDGALLVRVRDRVERIVAGEVRWG
jgi:BirA family biotin operon repressor/biotin-[acetyl-CoA-carboxylase] ligase